MRKMSHEMMEKAMHAKSTDELKAIMTASATPLDDSELDTITGGAGLCLLGLRNGAVFGCLPLPSPRFGQRNLSLFQRSVTRSRREKQICKEERNNGQQTQRPHGQR